MLGIVTEESVLNDLLAHISSSSIELEELEKVITLDNEESRFFSLELLYGIELQKQQIFIL